MTFETSALVDQQRIALQRILNAEHVVAHLLERVISRHIATISDQLDLLAVCIGYRIQPPVLHLQHHDALLRMQRHEIRMPAKRPDRNVVPHPGVVFEAILQPFGETQFAARIEAGSAEGGDQGGHGMGLVVMWGAKGTELIFLQISRPTSKTFRLRHL